MSAIGKLVDAIQFVKDPLTFWAFCVGGLVCVAAVFFGASSFHRTWSPVVKTMREGHLFKLFRMTILGILALIVCTLVLAFLGPYLLGVERHEDITEWLAANDIKVDARELQLVKDDFAKAMIVFREKKDYEKARAMLQKLRGSTAYDSSKESIDGIVTAAFYGSEKFEDGLNYIGQQYAHLPASDVRHRWRVHALLRKIALLKGFPRAEQLALRLKKEWGRSDFTPIWLGIALGEMESLHGGEVSCLATSRRTDDQEYLERALVNFPSDAFLDHALFFLGRDTEILKRYPKSLILDQATFCAGEQAEGIDAAVYFRDYLHRWQRGVRRGGAIAGLVRTHASSGSLDTLFSDLHRANVSSAEAKDSFSEVKDKFFERYGLLQALRSARSAGYGSVFADVDPLDEGRSSVALTDGLKIGAEFNLLQNIKIEDDYEHLDTGKEAYSNGDYGKAYKTYLRDRGLLRRYAVAEPEIVKNSLDELAEIIKLQRNRTPRGFLDLGIYLRDSAGRYSNAARAWADIVEKFPKSDYRPRAEFLIASSARYTQGGEEAAQEFKDFVRRYPNSLLADDALCEYGLQLQNDGRLFEARDVFEQVVSRYPNGNAADNALNWIAYGYLRVGLYSEALAAYQRLIKKYPLGRHALRAQATVDKLKPVAASQFARKTLRGLVLSGSGKILAVDHKLTDAESEYWGSIDAVNGRELDEKYTVWDALARRKSNEVVEISGYHWQMKATVVDGVGYKSVYEFR